MDWMKIYVRETAYYSGASYYEEVFVPLSDFEVVKDRIPEEIYLYDLDGKHSCLDAEVRYETFTEKDLEQYVFKDNYEGILYERICNAFDEMNFYDYDRDFVFDSHEEAKSYQQITTMKIEIHKDDVSSVKEFVRTLNKAREND